MPQKRHWRRCRGAGVPRCTAPVTGTAAVVQCHPINSSPISLQFSYYLNDCELNQSTIQSPIHGVRNLRRKEVLWSSLRSWLQSAGDRWPHWTLAFFISNMQLQSSVTCTSVNRAFLEMVKETTSCQSSYHHPISSAEKCTLKFTNFWTGCWKMKRHLDQRCRLNLQFVSELAYLSLYWCFCFCNQLQ